MKYELSFVSRSYLVLNVITLMVKAASNLTLVKKSLNSCSSVDFFPSIDAAARFAAAFYT